MNATAAVVLVSRLRRAVESGRTHDLAWREEQLRALLRMLEEHADDVADAVQADLRRPRTTATLLDVATVTSEARHALANLRRWAAPRRVPTPVLAQPGRAWVQHEPLGVVLVVSPWNYPVQLALVPLVAALAAGNAVVVKPSELTPACSAVLARLLPRYLDPDAVAVVEGGAEATQALLAAPVDHCFFTGSPAVGRLLAQAAAEHLTPVTLELGGKCPAVVTSSAQVRVAARRVVWSKVLNSGQTCVAADYALVDASVREEFLAEAVSAARRFTQRRPLPVLNAGHAERLRSLVEGAGGTTVLGGAVDVEAATAELTLVADPEPTSPLMREEVFGPVLPVVTVDGLDGPGGAVAHVRRGTRPLAAYLFSEDRAEQEQFTREVVAGGVVLNHVMLHLSVPELPFGGVGTSGTGRYHGHWGFEALSNPKAVLRQSARVDLPLVYPPFSRWKRALLRRLVG